MYVSRQDELSRAISFIWRWCRRIRKSASKFAVFIPEQATSTWRKISFDICDCFDCSIIVCVSLLVILSYFNKRQSSNCSRGGKEVRADSGGKWSQVSKDTDTTVKIHQCSCEETVHPAHLECWTLWGRHLWKYRQVESQIIQWKWHNINDSIVMHTKKELRSYLDLELRAVNCISIAIFMWCWLYVYCSNSIFES